MRQSVLALVCLVVAICCCGVLGASEQQFSVTLKPKQSYGILVDVGDERHIPSCIQGVSSNNEKLSECADHALLGWFLDTCAYPPLASGTTWDFTASSANASYINIFSALENYDVFEITPTWGIGESFFEFPGYISGSMVGGFSLFFNQTAWDKVNVTVTVNMTVLIYDQDVDFQIYANPGCPTKSGSYALVGEQVDGNYVLELTNDILQQYKSNDWNYFLVSSQGSGPAQLMWTVAYSFEAVS